MRRERHDARRRGRPPVRARTTSTPADIHVRRRPRQDGLPDRRRAGQDRSGSPSSSAYHTSRGVPPRELLDRCRRTLDRARRDGRRAAAGPTSARGSTTSGSAPTSRSRATTTIQQALRWNLFQLAQASARAEGSGIPAKGVTGSGYGGHYFWDTEIYVLPFLTYTPAVGGARTRCGSATRCSTRPGAGRRARPAGRPVPVAHDQRRGGVGLLRRRHRAVPHQRRHRVRAERSTSRRRGDLDFLDPRGHRHPGRDRPHVGRPRLLVQRRRRRLPHPRRHRAGRVHDGRQRQPVHQRHGALQPAPGGRGGA